MMLIYRTASVGSHNSKIMARTKQTSRSSKTHQDLLREAATTASFGTAFRIGRRDMGRDGVLRVVKEDGILRLYRLPRQRPTGYDTVRERIGRKRETRVYIYDDEPSTSRKSPRKVALPTKRGRFYDSDDDSHPLPKKVRFRPGTVALREIRAYQGRTVQVENKTQHIFHKTATQLLIPKQSFQKLVREIAQDIKSDLRFEVQAIAALQEAAESHLVAVFQDANIGAIHNGRETVRLKDMRFAGQIRRDPKPLRTDMYYADGEWKGWFKKKENNGCFHRNHPKHSKDEIPAGLYRQDGVADH